MVWNVKTEWALFEASIVPPMQGVEMLMMCVLGMPGVMVIKQDKYTLPAAKGSDKGSGVCLGYCVQTNRHWG